jgi:uncharacterized paraquat-inducible protein A
MNMAITNTLIVRLTIGLLLVATVIGSSAVEWRRNTSRRLSSTTTKAAATTTLTPVHMQPSLHHKQRQLQTTTSNSGDFDRFNELFQGASINIEEDFSITERVLFVPLTLDVLNVRCYSITIGDIAVGHTVVDSQNINVGVAISELDMICDVDYRYEYGLLHGTGIARVTTDNNSASTTLNFQSVDFSSLPPSSSGVGQCVTNIEITKIEFFEDLTSNIVEWFEEWIRDLIGSEIEVVACEELGTLGTTFVSDMLTIAEDFLLGYQNAPDGDIINDPMYVEESTVLPNDLVPLNFQDTDNVIGDWFNRAMAELDNLLGNVVPDPDGPNPDQRDLGVNVMLRSTLLNENRELVVDVDRLFPEMDAVLFKGHDQLTETAITLNGVRLIGLDTFTRFNPLIAIGKYTLENELTWEYLKIEVDVTIDIKPSSLEDAILQGATSEGITERIKINFAVENLDVVAALFMVVDQEALGSMEMGRLLHMDNILPCLLSVMNAVQFSGLHVDPLTIDPPSLSGFVSPGIDRIITEAVEAAFEMYGGVLEYAIPNVFQTSIKKIMNEQFIGSFIASSSADCPILETKALTGLIDFRDMLLPPEAAKSAGGSGTMPYGDLAHTAMTLLKDNLLSANEDGLLDLNSFLVQPATKSQSGTSGMIHFPNELISVNKTDFANEYVRSFIDSFHVGIHDLRVYNLDILKDPVSILDTTDSPYTLRNQLTMGPVINRPINITVGFRMDVQGPDSPFSMQNDIDISVVMDSASVGLDLFAQILAERLLRFPLRDVMNANCWLATFPAPEKGGEIHASVESSSTLSVSSIVLALSSLNVDINVISSSSAGIGVVPDLLNIFIDSGANAVLSSRISQFGEEMMSGESLLQSYIDKTLSDAHVFCPHDPAYDDTAVRNAQTLLFPPMSPESIDTFFFTAAVAAETAVVVFMESHLLEPFIPSDPLSAQNLLANSDQYVDFTNLESELDSEIGSFVMTTLNQLKSYLSEPADSGDLAINQLVRDFLLDDQNRLFFEFDDLSFVFPGVDIAFRSISVHGLDSFTFINVFDPIAPQTFTNNFKLETISVELELDVTSQATGEKQNDLKIGLTVKGLEATVPLFMALDLAQINNLQLGSILLTENILPCLLSILSGVKIPQLTVSIEKFAIPKIVGLMPETNSSFYAFTSTVFETYQSRMIAAVQSVADGPIRILLNGLIDAFIKGQPCPNYKSNEDLGYVDFRDFFSRSTSKQYGDLPAIIMEFVDSELLSTNSEGIPKINDVLISPFTASQSGVEGTLMYEGDLFETGTQINVGGLNADIRIRANNAKIENLNTVSAPLVLLEPVETEPYWLNNSATLGLEQQPMRLSTRLFFAVAGDETQISNEMDIELDLSALNLILAAMIKIAKSRLLGFPIRDVFDLNCWIATIPAPLLDAQGMRRSDAELTAALAEVAATIGQLNLNVTCIECSSPGMWDLTQILSTPQAQADATAAINNVLDAATNLMGGNFLQVQVDRLLNDASRRCPHSPDYNPNAAETEYAPLEAPESESNVTYLALVGATVLALAVAVGLLMLVIRYVVRRRHKRFLARLPSTQAKRLMRLQQRQNAVEAELNDSTVAMFQSHEIPCLLRYAMPIVILGNIGLFLSGHLSLGATVNIEATFAGETIKVDNFFEFSMARSTIDIWNAGGKALAILILIFSVIWPYTKQIMTMILWFLPPSKVSMSQRGSILLWLDWLAKWSMIDIFVLVVSIAAFRVSIQSPEVLFLPQGFYSVDLLVVPLWGLYANMTAQLVSQISSHFIIHYHRRIVNKATMSYMERHHLDCSEQKLKNMPSSPTLASVSDCEAKRLLWKHQYGRPHRGETDKLIVRSWVSFAVVAMSLSLIILVILGCTFPSFSLDVLGLIGVAVESGQDWDDATTYFSVFTVVQLLMEEARFLDTARAYIGLGTFSVIFVATVLFVPIFQALALLRTWFVPLNMRQRTRMSIANEILQAWQYAEVYLIAIFVASWQLGPISEFMINSYCDSLDGFFAQMVYFGILKEEDAQCFRVQSSIETGSFILAAGAILLALLNTFVSKAVKQYINDKSTLERQVLDEKIESDLRELDDEEGSPDTDTDNDSKSNDGASITIHPVPVLFTDTFRWLLRRDELSASSCRASEVQCQISLPPHSMGDTDSGKGLSFDDDAATIELQYTSSGSNVIGDDTCVSNTDDAGRGHVVGPDVSDGGSVAPPPLPIRSYDEECHSQLELPHGSDTNVFDVMVEDAYIVESDNDSMSTVEDE